MKLTTVLLAGVAMFAAAGAQAQTATLFDGTNLQPQLSTPTSYTFVAASNQSIISFAGYDAPDFITVDAANVISGANTIFLNNFDFTPAPQGSYAYQYTDQIGFGGTSEGSYDIFSTTLATVQGTRYSLNFGLEVDSDIAGSQDEVPPPVNGLRITVSNATIPGAVPEPATWGMMVLGFGMMGFGLRARRRSTKVTYA